MGLKSTSRIFKLIMSVSNNTARSLLIDASSKHNMKRLYNLDYLRGMAAFGIMIYHYLSWSIGDFPADSFLGRIGVYGVSIFYILSGLTLHYVYELKMKPSKTDLINFAKKRFFRIYPLLWLATILSIIVLNKYPNHLNLNKEGIIELVKWGGNVFLNLTGLFGLIRWDGYFATGAWSIGNELVFYLFFPVFIFLKKKSVWAFTAFSILILGIYIYFAFYILHADHPFDSRQWTNYVNPLNQLFLFLGGFLIVMLFKNLQIPVVINFLILCCGLSLLTFYPATGDGINLVTGVNRMVFTLSCFLITFSFYKTTIRLPEFFDRPLTLLGEASYSVYLLHPLVYLLVERIFSFLSKRIYNFPSFFVPILSIFITLLISYVVYQKYEKYFMRLGK